MAWFDRFRKKQSSKIVSFNPYEFGRFSDAFKTPKKYEVWEESLLLFDEGKRFSAFRKFFEYLTNERGENIFITSEQGNLRFRITQGSKELNGIITAQTVQVQTFMAKAKSYPKLLMINLLEENYNLKFCKYAFNDHNDLMLVSYSAVKVTSPYKLYYTLKEIALTADKKDDLIYSKYGLANPSQKKLLPRARKLVSYQYIQDLFLKVMTIKEAGIIDTDKYPSALRYLLLAAIYKVDFLVKPEGLVMDYLEKVDKLAFSGQSNDPKIINTEIVKILNKILTIPKDVLLKELYVTDATFGINPVIRSAQIRDTIFSELPTMDWYIEQGATPYALAIVDFVVGYLSFNFSVPPPCKALFLLYYRIREPKFFAEMGMADEHFGESKKFPSLVKKEIRKILKHYQKAFPHAEAPLHLLEFEDRVIFYKRYLEMIAEINFTPK